MTDATASRVLVVDDEMLIAMLIETMLDDLGCVTVGPAHRLGEALTLARGSQIDCALLDFDLCGQSSLPIARVLSERNIRFAFVSGGGAVDVSAEFREAPRLRKPFTAEELAEVLLGLDVAICDPRLQLCD